MNNVRFLAITILLSITGYQGTPFGIAAAAVLPSYDRVRVLQSARDISEVELVDQDGRPFHLSQLRGQIALVFFGFTNCPDVCPIALQRLRQLEEHGGDDLADIAYVMISVDGERDTPDVLKTFLARFSPRFIGLTGEPGNVKAIAAEFSVAFFEEGANKGGGYAVSHSPQVFVVDQAGQLRAEFYYATFEAMNGVILALIDETKDTPKSEIE